jgi:hypothetical protein
MGWGFSPGKKYSFIDGDGKSTGNKKQVIGEGSFLPNMLSSLRPILSIPTILAQPPV